MHMFNKYRFFLYGCLFIHSTIFFADRSEVCLTVPYFPNRSAHVDVVRELINWTQYSFCCDKRDRCADIICAVIYGKSFYSNQMARFLFGNSLITDCDSMRVKVSGSRVFNRNGKTDWLADYFGLPPDFESIFYVHPCITNTVFYFTVHVPLDSWIDGAYFTLNAPLVRTVWDLGFCERVLNSGEQGYTAGYMSPEPVMRDQLLSNFTQFASGSNTVPNLGSQIVVEPLQAGKFPLRPLKKTALAALEGILGWRLLNDEDYFFTINIRGVIPTGTRPKGEFLFEPTVGTGGYAELGGGLLAFVNVWRDITCIDRHVNFYLAANVTHLFPVEQTRLFDIRGRNNSRYMRAQKMSRIVKDGLEANDRRPQAQFDNYYLSIANLTRFNVDVSINWQADFAFLFNYVNKSFTCNCGYNYWTRQPEIIKLINNPGINRLAGASTWAVKGDAAVFGFREDTNEPVALSATQSRATVTTGLNFENVFDFQEGMTNPRIDDPQEATAQGVVLLAQPGGIGGAQINTSLPPRFLELENVAVCRARSQATSHTIFAHMEYRWCEIPLMPHVGFGSKVSFSSPFLTDDACGSCIGISSQDGGAPCGICSNSARDCTISEWSVWIQGGISF